jgi:hypothetical protein
MVKDASLFTYLDEAMERMLYVANNFSLNIVCHDDVSYWNEKIFDICHLPKLSANHFSFS